MDFKSEDLIIFQTCYGTYKYKVLPFKLTNGLATYQQYINDILFDYFNDFYIAYLNNIIIYFKNELKYKEYIYKILQRLQKAGLQVNIKKLKFSIKCIKYLGFIISINGIKADLKKIVIISQWEPPQIVKGYSYFQVFATSTDALLRTIVGLLNLLPALLKKTGFSTLMLYISRPLISLKSGQFLLCYSPIFTQNGP